MKPKFKHVITRSTLGFSFGVAMMSGSSAQVRADTIPLIAPEISLTAPAAFRAVQGASLSPLSFSTTNLNPTAPTTFNLDLKAGSAGQLNSLRQPDPLDLPNGILTDLAPATPWSGVVLLPGSVGSISATPNISGLTAGQSMNFGIEATNSNWTSPVSASSNINVVTDRLLTGSATINAGRHVTGANLGSVSLNGGSLTDTQASRVSVNGGGYAQLANGLRLTAPGNFTFNGAGQSRNLNVAYSGPVGNYSISSATLPGANSYTDTLGNVLHQFGGDAPTPNQRINPLITGENIQGSSLNLSGVSLTVTGTAVANRLLTGSATIDAGRHMAGLQSIGTITLSGGAATDSEATRISVSSGGYAQLANGLRLTSASDFTFNGANQTHDLQISYNRPTGAYNITAATLPGAGASNYTDASGNAHQEFGGAWKTSAEYGNVFGQKQVFTEQNRTDWRQISTTVWQRPGTSGYYATDYIYSQEIATTAQPTAAAIRSTGNTSSWELARGAGPLVNERINPLISGEVIKGSSLNLSGVALTVTGTAVADRSIYGGTVHLGRRMVGAAGETINRSDTVTLSTSGSDEHATRLNLQALSLNNGTGTTATHLGSSAFTDSTHTASLQLTGKFALSTTTQGRNFQGVNAGSSIIGEGLAGETKQSSLDLGYTWNNVQNNGLYTTPLLVIESSNRSEYRSYETYVGRTFDTETHTAIGWTGNEVVVNGSLAPGIYNLGNRTVTATAEGLAGENATATASFNTRYASVAAATFTATHTGAATGPLTDGNTVTIRDTGSGVYQNNVEIANVALSGGQNLDYQLIYGGGDSMIQHGENRTFTIDFIGNSNTVLAGELGRISRADLSIGLQDRLNYSGIIDASGISAASSNNYTTYGYYYYSNTLTLATQTYQLETRFDAPAAQTASSQVAAGTDFGVNGLTLTNTSANTSTRFTRSTDVELLDSNALTSSKQVKVEFVKLTDASPAVVAALENPTTNAASQAGISGGGNHFFVSDIVNLTGLDGEKQVVQIGYDSSVVGDQGKVQLLWRYDYSGPGGSAQVAWINAVLGNSNITNLDLIGGTLQLAGNGVQSIQAYLSSNRFTGSYDEYLATNGSPELGKWGLDPSKDKVWAVIDHNSFFAASVPEPSLSLMVVVGFGCLSLRRRVR